MSRKLFGVFVRFSAASIMIAPMVLTTKLYLYSEATRFENIYTTTGANYVLQ
jgi:hypothetical protein